MSDLLQEYFDSRGLALRVDRQTGSFAESKCWE